MVEIEEKLLLKIRDKLEFTCVNYEKSLGQLNFVYRQAAKMEIKSFKKMIKSINEILE